MLLITHRLQVRFNDCDPMGHVNNSVYLTYLEQARLNLWRAQLGYLGASAADTATKGLGFIMARTEIDFRAQARYGDDLDVKVSLDGFGRTSFTYSYEIVNAATAAVMAAAKTVIVRFDYELQKPAPLDDATKAQLSVPLSPGGPDLTLGGPDL